MAEEETTETTETEDSTAAAERARGQGQAPLHLPPKLREAFGKVEGAFAERPGFRNTANSKSKAQKKKRKKKR